MFSALAGNDSPSTLQRPKKKYSSKHDHPFRLPISSAHLQILNRLTLYNKQPCASLQLHYSKSRKTLAEKRATSVGGARCLLYSAQRKSLNSPTLSFNILTYLFDPVSFFAYPTERRRERCSYVRRQWPRTKRLFFSFYSCEFSSRRARVAAPINFWKKKKIAADHGGCVTRASGIIAQLETCCC